MLEYNKVSYQVNSKKILQDINFKLKEEEITTIIGPNGSGKSTLLKLLSIDEKNYDGEITINGSRYQTKTDYPKIALLKQSTNIVEHLTVLEFLKLCCVATKPLFYQVSVDDMDRINEKMKLCDCCELSGQLISTLSGGERQRVLICAAIMDDPKLLILDEPTTFLDIKYQQLVINLIKKLNKEKKVTVLLVLHDINQAISYSDNIIMIKSGQIIFDDECVNVTTNDLTNCFDIKFTKHYNFFTTKVTN